MKEKRMINKIKKDIQRKQRKEERQKKTKRQKYKDCNKRIKREK